jgi:hypothetical protein
MIVTYHGGYAVKIQQGNFTLAVNPPTADSKFKTLRFGADIVLESLRDPDVAGGELLSAGDKNPFVINGPGEYEISDIFIYGLPTTTHYGDSNRINTVYYFTYEDVRFCFLGLHGEDNLPTEVTETIDEIDILFLPVSGDGVMDPVAAYKLAVKLEPKVIVPIGFDDKKNKDLAAFMKEAGEPLKWNDKLTFKRKDVESLSKISLLDPQ